MAFRKAAAASAYFRAFVAASPWEKRTLAAGVPLLSRASSGLGSTRSVNPSSTVNATSRARVMEPPCDYSSMLPLLHVRRYAMEFGWERIAATEHTATFVRTTAEAWVGDLCGLAEDVRCGCQDFFRKRRIIDRARQRQRAHEAGHDRQRLLTP